MPSSNNNTELKVTSAEEWDVEEGQLLQLPSGKVIRARRSMDLIHLLKAGKIPNPLGPLVQRMIDSGGSDTPQMKELGMEGLSAMMAMVDDCVLRVVIEPKVVPAPPMDEGETPEDYMQRVAGWRPDDRSLVGINQIDLDDRMYIFLFAQGMASDLESFREEQKAAMASPQDGAAVPAKAKQPRRAK